MAALVRSSARRLAGSALLQRAPEGTQAVPAAGALLHQKNQHLDMDALRQPFLSRFMSTKRTAEYVLFEEARFSKLMKSVKSAKELDMNDVLMLESFKKLAHMRDRLPVKLSYWDSIILAAKARVIPTNTTHVRQRLHKFCLVFFAVLVVLSRCSTRSEWLGVGERFIRRKYPLVAAFFSWDDK